MSLLLDALKRAEQAKKAKSDEAASGSAQPGSPPTPPRTAEQRVSYSGPERRELQLTDREDDVLPRETPSASAPQLPSLSPPLSKSPSPSPSPSPDGSVPVQAPGHVRRTNVPTPRTLAPAEAVQEAAPRTAAPVNSEIAKPVLVGRSSAASARSSSM